MRTPQGSRSSRTLFRRTVCAARPARAGLAAAHARPAFPLLRLPPPLLLLLSSSRPHCGAYDARAWRRLRRSASARATERVQLLHPVPRAAWGARSAAIGGAAHASIRDTFLLPPMSRSTLCCGREVRASARAAHAAAAARAGETALPSAALLPFFSGPDLAESCAASSSSSESSKSRRTASSPSARRADRPRGVLRRLVILTFAASRAPPCSGSGSGPATRWQGGRAPSTRRAPPPRAPEPPLAGNTPCFHLSHSRAPHGGRGRENDPRLGGGAKKPRQVQTHKAGRVGGGLAACPKSRGQHPPTLRSTHCDNLWPEGRTGERAGGGGVAGGTECPRGRCCPRSAVRGKPVVAKHCGDELLKPARCPLALLVPLRETHGMRWKRPSQTRADLYKLGYVRRGRGQAAGSWRSAQRA